METYQVKKIYGLPWLGKKFRVKVPGSKSITNRALLLAMLSDGECELTGALFSDDSRYLQQCIADLGFEICSDEEKETIRVKGLSGQIPKREASLYVGSAGTAARFLTALLGLKEGVWHLDASEQMRRRPMQPLLASLEELGARVSFEGEMGHFPFTLRSHRNEKEEISIDIGHSSQFLSALLIAAGSGDRDLDIRMEGTHGMAYIDMTVRLMEQFGVPVGKAESLEAGECRTGSGGNCAGPGNYRIKAGAGYRHQDHAIEPDVSAACYFYAMAALLGIEGVVEGVHFDSLQGDVEFIRILERMGAVVWEAPEGIHLKGPADGRLKGITVDMHACSDQAITLAAIAPFADGPVRITGIGHIRYQESDRLTAIATELSRIKIRCEKGEDEIVIYPGMPEPGEIETYDDHRMAMGFSLVGLRADGIKIKDPGCCRKTFAHYFQVLDKVIEGLACARP